MATVAWILRESSRHLSNEAVHMSVVNHQSLELLSRISEGPCGLPMSRVLVGHEENSDFITYSQSMLPQVKGSKKLNHRRKPPLQPSPEIFVIRPYRLEDKELLYRTCLETGDNGGDATGLFTNYPNLLGDRFVGPYLTLCRDLAFVLEDSQGVCGYVLAVLNSEQFYSRFKREWLPTMLEKYPIPITATTTSLSKSGPEESLLGEICHLKFFLPELLQRDYPSHIHIDLMQRAQGQGVGVRMIKTILATLKAKDSRGVHLEMSTENIRALKFYRKLGFKPLRFTQEPLPAKNVTVLGRFL